MKPTPTTEDCCDVKHLDTEKITALLQCGTLESCRAVVDDYLNQIHFREMESLMLRLYIGMDIYIVARSFAKEIGVSSTEFNTSFGTIDEIAARLQTADDTTEVLHQIVAQCIRWRIGRAADAGNNVIRKAKEYIDANYMHDDLSLKQVAYEVGLSPSYLSAVFKRDMKLNFSDYLTKVRIQHSKELLCCSARMIYEVAYEVGFRDYRYFSQIFKKHTGQTPRQFQNTANLCV